MEQDTFRRVSVVGLGYIGLPTAATLATRGVEVVGVDINPHVISRLNAGKAHFSEPDLDILLDASVSTGKLRGVEAPEPADVFVIAVPTPFNADHSADLGYVEAAARSVARVLEPGNLVILESTSPVGTTQKVADWIAEESGLKPPRPYAMGDYHVAYCPERILPGRMVFELVQNDRVIGGMTPACSARAAEFYRLFVRGALVHTTASAAEFVKLIENAYRDVNIAFANELSILSDSFGIDVWEAISLANRHPRVNILRPGPGVGGHCIAVDPWFLISADREHTPLLAAARQVNDAKPEVVMGKIRERLRSLDAPVVACLGLSYKPDIDDMRESPALLIVETLAEEGVELRVVEPHVEALPCSLSDRANVTLVELESALEEADVVAVLVGHTDFAEVRPEALEGRAVIDTVGLWQGNGARG